MLNSPCMLGIVVRPLVYQGLALVGGFDLYRRSRHIVLWLQRSHRSLSRVMRFAPPLVWQRLALVGEVRSPVANRLCRTMIRLRHHLRD
jgi:hypothetical protein